ncbi:MAG: secretin and TonB N-terminal domain-containing protein [Planctomycetes bacterium]|nr:secretin and TonB N-terminal domain-containing protein [Planctomycetota bacterium]MBI3847561.1 secretin and TonB N-terminal domain-containing protein [Planctomycetota bacterium]
MMLSKTTHVILVTWTLCAALFVGCAAPQPQAPSSRPGPRNEDEARLLARSQSKGWIDVDPRNALAKSQKPRAAAPVASVVAKPPAPKAVPAASVPVKATPDTTPMAPSIAPPAPITSVAVADVPAPVVPVAATDPAAPPTTINPASSIELRDVELRDLLRATAKLSGKNVIVPDSLTQKVTLSLNGMTLDDALAAVLKANQLELVEESGIYRVKAIEGPPQPKVQSRGFTLTSVPIGNVQKTIEPLMTPSGKMVMSPESNSFLVIDMPEAIERIEEFVKLLDRRERQVLIEARILEVILTHDDEIGVSLAFNDISIDNVTAMFTQDLRPANRAFRFSVLGDSGRINAVLDAISQKRQVNLLSHPSVSTVNGQKATIEVLESIPYIDATATTTTSAGGLGATTVSQIKFVDKGITLTVTPLIGEDRVIKMTVVPEVRELTDFFNGVPVIDRRRVETSILVHDSQTIVIGGLVRENHVQGETKTPILGDIPLLGALFRKRQDNIEKSELLVLITPRILDPGADEAITQERQKSIEEAQTQYQNQYDGEKK